MRLFFIKVIKKIENSNLNTSIYSWVFSLFGVIFIRTLIEAISTSTTGFIEIPRFNSSFLHYPSAYIAVFLFLVLIFYFLSEKSKINILTTTKVFGLGTTIILLVPIFDMVLTLGKGEKMRYMIFNPHNPLETFFFLFTKPPGLTNGQRLEIALLLLLISFYFYYKNKNFIKAAIIFFLNYLLLFIFLSFPSLILLISNFFQYRSFSYTFPKLFTINPKEEILGSRSILSDAYNYPANLRIVLDNESANLAVLWIFIVVLLLNIWFYLYDKDKFISFWKNSRPERIIYYLFFLIIGFFIANNLGIYSLKWSFFNILSLFCLITTLIASWLFQANINDIYDQKIDRISNPNRPLIKNTLTLSDIKILNFFLILVILFSSFALGYEIVFLLTCWNSAYFLYSSFPFRLKRFAFISNILIGIAGGITVLLGIAFVSKGLWLGKISNNLFLIIVLLITLISHVKDIKDIKGDKKNNIKTIPVIFGEKLGKNIIAFMVLFAAIIVSYLLNNFLISLISVVWGIIAFFLIIKKNYKEKYLFILLYSYLLILLIYFGK